MTDKRAARPAVHPMPPHLSLHTAPRETLADTVAKQLLHRISGLPHGSRLPALDQLASQLGVSRMTVREALRGLAALGMVDIKHGSGVYVASPGDPGSAIGPEALSGEFGRDLVEARQLIEVDVAGLAAERLTEADEAALVAVLTEHHHQLAAGKHPVIPGSEFHMRLLAATKNKVLEGYLSSFFRIMINRGPALYETVAGYAAEEYEQHRAILEAVRTRNADVARLRMKQHLVYVSDLYLRSFAE